MLRESVEDWLAGLIASIEPAGRRKLARKIGIALRRSQQQRINLQRNADGTPYEPRKPLKPKFLRKKVGRIKKQMFERLRRAEWLKVESDANVAAVAFAGRVQRIAQVHQWGLRDRVEPHGPEVRYPARELLGFTEEDRKIIEQLVIEHLASI